jgi:NADH-quinone oxidoreductase subunit J
VTGPVTSLAVAALADGGAARTSTGEAVGFWLLGSLAVIGALGMVGARKAVHSAICLATTMLVLAVFYMAEGALFLGVVQIVVYTGAVMMLFLFVLMLIGVDSAESLVETLRGQRIGTMLAGLGFGALLIGGIGNATMVASVGLGRANENGNVQGLAELIFIRYVWAFELTGALLITATIGAMVLAHREQLEHRRDQKSQSVERFKELGGRGEPGEHPTRVTPLPSPGVYARHNAVDMPARLPDGSLSRLSVSPVLHPRDEEVSQS